MRPPDVARHEPPREGCWCCVKGIQGTSPPQPPSQGHQQQLRTRTPNNSTNKSPRVRVAGTPCTNTRVMYINTRQTPATTAPAATQTTTPAAGPPHRPSPSSPFPTSANALHQHLVRPRCRLAYAARSGWKVGGVDASQDFRDRAEEGEPGPSVGAARSLLRREGAGPIWVGSGSGEINSNVGVNGFIRQGPGQRRARNIRLCRWGALMEFWWEYEHQYGMAGWDGGWE